MKFQPPSEPRAASRAEQPGFHVLLMISALLSASALRADNVPPASAAPKAVGQRPSTPAQEAVILHEWPGTVALGFNAQGRLLAYDSARRVFEIHDLAATNAAVTGWNLPEDGGRVFGGALSADRGTLATVSEVSRNQSRIQLWNARTGEMTGPEFAPSDVAHVAFSPDGKTLAGVVALDGTVRVWETATGKLRWSQALPSPMQVAWIGIQFSPDGRFVAARNSYALQIWDVAARKVAGAGDLSFYLAISPDWKLAHGFVLKPAAQQPPRSTLLDITDPNQPHAATNALPEELMASLEMAAFSPDSRFLALSLRDQTIRLWNLTDRRVVHQMADAGGRTIRLLVSPDNRRLATYEVDLTQQRSTLRGSVRVWDVATGQALGSARPHPGTFWDWQFDPDSRHLVVSFAHGNDMFGAQIWGLPPGEATEATAPKPASPVSTPVGLPRAVVPSADAGYPRDGDRLTPVPNPSAPRIARRTYTADLRSWPASRTEHGVAAFEAGGYVMRPYTNTWIGPGRKLDITPLDGDFVLELKFRITDRKPSAALTLDLAGTGATADYVGVHLDVWSDTNVTHTIEKGTIKDNFYANRDESIAERVPAPKVIADHDWSQGGRITLHRERNTMRLLVNGSLLQAFPVSQFVVRKVGLGAALESAIVVTSLEAGTP